MRQTEKQIREAIAPVADDLAKACAEFRPAQGADSVAEHQLRFLRVIAVGTPDVTDATGTLLTSDSFNGGFFGLTKTGREKAVGIFQYAYDLLKLRLAIRGVAGKRGEQMHQVMQGIAQVAMHGSTSQVKAVTDSFRFGPTEEGSPTINNVKAVVRSQVDAMMHDAQVSFTDSKGVVHSIGGYNERVEAIQAQEERLRTMRKPVNSMRNGLYKAFTKAERSYIGDARAKSNDLTALEAITSSTDEDMIALAEALAERGYTLAPTS